MPQLGDPGGVLVQVEPVSASLGTLAAKTALTLSSTFTGTTATFLMKRVQYNVLLTAADEFDGPYYLGVANGDASATEITEGMVYNNTSGPEDFSQVREATRLKAVLWGSLDAGVETGITTGTDKKGIHFTGDFSFGKGIPWPEGAGWKIFIYNASANALQTGSGVNGMIHSHGVWLRD